MPLPPHLEDAFLGYFRGEFDSFDELMTGRFGTPFERAVWAALRTIPPGETRSYAAIAALLGDIGKARAVGAANARNPLGKARAVGAANARNPLAIIIPCHRVIGSDGGLTGYAGGLERKQWLLRHEGWQPAQDRML